MEGQSSKVSIIIPTLNRVSSLARTLGFISKSSIPPDEVIIVDQSPIDTAEKIKELCDSQTLKIKYIHINEPSLTGARNAGIELCKNDIAIFMDDDVDIGTDTIKNILVLFKDNSISMVAGIDSGSPMKRLSLPSLIFFRSSFFKRYKGHVAMAGYGVFPQNPQAETPTEWAMGFFFAIRKSLAQKWGLKFDENLKYYAYAEDMDFTYRYFLKSKEENLKCIMSTAATVLHNVSKEYRLPSRQRTFMEICHRRYVMSKHGNSILRKLIMLWSDIGTAILRIKRGEPASDVFKAIAFAIKYRRDIKKGVFHYDKFM